jgi:cell wall-associated NlpC family hydrolase
MFARFFPLFFGFLVLVGCSTLPQDQRKPNGWFDFKPSQESVFRKSVIDEARTHIGQQYVWNQSGPTTFDCSGFVYYILKTVLSAQAFPLGYSTREIPAGYTAQSAYYRDELLNAGAQVDCNRAKIADIVYFPNVGTEPGHIGLISDPAQDLFITAQSRATGVAEQSFNRGSYWETRQPICFHNIWIDSAVRISEHPYSY